MEIVFTFYLNNICKKFVSIFASTNLDVFSFNKQLSSS